MSNIIITGAQWGDEGKAKIVDYLSKDFDVIVRFQGGANAGHTVVIDGKKFIFHMIPSGIMTPGKTCIIGNGVVFDAEQFLSEIEGLHKMNINTNRLYVSDLAHLVLPYHKLLDAARECYLKKNSIGTTIRGIGVAYMDKIQRNGIRVCDCKDWNTFFHKLKNNYNEAIALLKHYKYDYSLTFEKLLLSYDKIIKKLLPYVISTEDYLYKCLIDKKSILFEGAQGTFLDIDHGTYPYVTSSNTIAGAACTGSGIGPTHIDGVIGIVKTYTIRVGNGPFPTELKNEIGEFLQKEGKEFGATTGRPRRCGWYDSVMVRKAIRLNGYSSIVLTKLDILSKLKEIKICTKYDKRELPVYITLDGWECDISKCKTYEELPYNAKMYVCKIKELCYNIPILLISVGPDRNQTIII